MVKPGLHTGDLSHTIQKYVESEGFNIIKAPYAGTHSIGTVHMDGLYVPYLGFKPDTGHVLQVGHVIAIEPAICTGDGETVTTYYKLGDETIATMPLRTRQRG